MAFGLTRPGCGERRGLAGRTLWKERQKHGWKYQDGAAGDAGSDQESANVEPLFVIES